MVTCSDDGSTVDLVAAVDDPEGAYDFYLDALPDAGYTISEKDAVDVAGIYGANISFTGGEFEGAGTSIVIGDVGGAALTVHLER